MRNSIQISYQSLPYVEMRGYLQMLSDRLLAVSYKEARFFRSIWRLWTYRGSGFIRSRSHISYRFLTVRMVSVTTPGPLPDVQNRFSCAAQNSGSFGDGLVIWWIRRLRSVHEER